MVAGDRDYRQSKSMLYEMQTETNLELISRDDSIDLGMRGKMSVRNLGGASEIEA